MRLNPSSLGSHSSRLIDPYHKFSSNIQAVGAREVRVSSIGPREAVRSRRRAAALQELHVEKLCVKAVTRQQIVLATGFGGDSIFDDVKVIMMK